MIAFLAADCTCDKIAGVLRSEFIAFLTATTEPLLALNLGYMKWLCDSCLDSCPAKEKWIATGHEGFHKLTTGLWCAQ